MTRPDFNLLVVLDVLLAEGSVTRAAKRLRLSPSATSRALARLREVTGDPLLVRAGRGLVATPRAVELRERTGVLVEEIEAVLRPVAGFDPARLVRTFALRNRDGFVEAFGPALVERVGREAPGVLLRFVAKTDKDSAPLRDGSVDLETGVIGEGTGPEVRAVMLFRDRFVGVARIGHPLFAGPITVERFAAGDHVLVARRDRGRGPVDAGLEGLGAKRRIAAVVGSYGEAAALVRGSDLIGDMPERYTERLRDQLRTFDLPFAVPEITVSLMWHPRLEADPAHRWLLGVVREVCGTG